MLIRSPALERMYPNPRKAREQVGQSNVTSLPVAVPGKLMRLSSCVGHLGMLGSRNSPVLSE
jgi:hypothetical protein